MIEAIGRMIRRVLYSLLYIGEFLYIRAKAFFIYFYSHMKTRRRREWSVLAALVMWVVYSFVFAAPADFPVHMLLPVKQGSTLEEVASNLKAAPYTHLTLPTCDLVL